MLYVSCVFVLLAGLVSGQLQFSLLTSLQPPPTPQAILQPPPPPPPPLSSTRNLALAPQRSPFLNHGGLTLLAPPPLLSPSSLSPPPPPPRPTSSIPQGRFTASPPEVSSGFTGIPGPRPALSSEVGELSSDEVSLPTENSDDATPSPGVASPTTIRFTLNDVPRFEPSLFPPSDSFLEQTVPTGSTPSAEELDLSLQDEDPPTLASSAVRADLASQLYLLTSGRSLTSSTEKNDRGRDLGDERSPLLVSSIEVAEADFKPSLRFPFLFDSTEESRNEFTLVEERNPKVSFLRPEPSNSFESAINGFVLKPVKVEPQKGNDDDGDQKSAPHAKSKTPVPTKVDMGDVADSSTSDLKATKPPPTRKTLHFNQELLTLLRTAAAEKNSKGGSSSSPRPFWLNVPKSGGVWRLKGGERASPSAHPKTPTAGGVFAKSIKNLVTTAALSTTTVPTTTVSTTVVSTTTVSTITESPSNVTSTKSKDVLPNAAGANVTSEGPTVVAVGEVGEVLPDLEAAHTHAVPTTLSAALKHGVQALSVSARASGCPKLYGKVELTCSVNHDAVANTAMKMMWKKKSFLEGRLEEQIVAEDAALRLEDSRLSLKHVGDSYTLVIKDFRAKDCGTYECEVRAADATAASQLLLFTCL